MPHLLITQLFSSLLLHPLCCSAVGLLPHQRRAEQICHPTSADSESQQRYEASGEFLALPSSRDKAEGEICFPSPQSGTALLRWGFSAACSGNWDVTQTPWDVERHRNGPLVPGRWLGQPGRFLQNKPGQGAAVLGQVISNSAG